MNYDMAIMRFTQLLPSEGYEVYDNIVIDLNSLLSPFGYISVIQEIKNRKLQNILLQDILRLLQNMILNIFNGKHIFIVLRDIQCETYALDELFPNFRELPNKDFDSRLYQSLFGEILKVVMKLNEFNTVEVLVEKEGEHVFLVDNIYNKYSLQNVLILSRDPLMLLNCIYPEITAWNGTHYYNENKVQEYKKGTTLYTYIPPAMLRYVFLICGVRKTSYKGIRGINVVKLVKEMKKDGFFSSEKIQRYLKEVEKYKPLFFVRDYKSFLLERKIKQGGDTNNN